MNKEIIYVDLFSGTGAFAKGLLDAGFTFKKQFFSEIDIHAIANYKYNFKNADYVGPVEKVNTREIPQPDILTFGSPCQDLSHAGTRKGIKGNKSKRFFDAIGLINQLRPKVFVFENVKGLLFSNKGKDFEIVLRTIANLGLYECQWQLVNTAWFLPQNRERLFLVGNLRTIGSSSIFPLLERYNENLTQRSRINIIKRYSSYRQDIIYSTTGCSPTLTVGKGSPGSYIKVGRRVRRLTPIEQERLQGLPDNWTQYGIFEGVKKEISKTQRYKLLGNAITATVMEKIGKKLLTSDSKKNPRKEQSKIKNIAEQARNLLKALQKLNK